MSQFLSDSAVNTDLVEQILEQGQRLRNSMVRSILVNDPFHIEVTNGGKNVQYSSQCTPNQVASMSPIAEENFSDDRENFSLCQKHRSWSNVQNSCTDILSAVNKTEWFDNICLTKNVEDADSFKQTFPETFEDSEDLSSSESTENFNVPMLKLVPLKTDEYLKRVDCLRITISTLSLTQAGIRKVAESCVDQKYRVSASSNHTYFVEYVIPEMLRVESKSNSKVDSGAGSSNTIRICSRKLHNEDVYFKQTFIHDINVNRVDLNDASIMFKVSSRTLKQKDSVLLGTATFKMDIFAKTETHSCDEELKLADPAMLLSGTLKASFELGCGKRFFGKDFGETFKNGRKTFKNDLKETKIEKDVKGELNDADDVIQNPKFENTNFYQQQHNCAKIKDDEKQLLFGLFYISEAQYLEISENTYFTCRPFCQDHRLVSKIIFYSNNPIFNCYQIVPLMYDDEFLGRMRDNCVLLEFCQKIDQSERLFGICKLPLHQFYITYRNPVIVKHLRNNQLPIIGIDWWEPIYKPCIGEICGQVKVLCAIGTEAQIENLQYDRGFKEESVTARSTSIIPENNNLSNIKRYPFAIDYVEKEILDISNNTVSFDENTLKIRKYPAAKTVSTGTITDFKKIDVAVQSNMECSTSNTQVEVIQDFFTKLMMQPQKNIYVENSTNTEEIINVPLTHPTNNDQVRVKNQNGLQSTSDLLNSLQTALTVNNDNNNTSDTSTDENRQVFKAHIAIEGALHLPNRRKCKSKKTKGRNAKYEEIFPSTYVTFDTAEGLKMTSVVQKNSNPQWNFRSDALVSTVFLTGNKRMIFKVWRKSQSQTDVVLGFAAVDLTVLTVGLPSVQGWFNVVDFSSKSNGQIKIHLTPLENLLKFKNFGTLSEDEIKLNFLKTQDTMEEPSELLSRTLKRKFVELEQITQRLRSRLADVTATGSCDSDTSNDELADEFERDINTLCVEDDFGMIDFEKIPQTVGVVDSEIGLLQDQSEQFSNFGDSQVPHVLLGDHCDTFYNLIRPSTDQDSFKPNSILDKQLIEGKQRIDTLLEKLSLMSTCNSSSGFSSRYVSGCSVERDAGHTQLNNFECFSNPSLFQQLCNTSLKETCLPNSESLDSVETTSDSLEDDSISRTIQDLHHSVDHK